MRHLLVVATAFLLTACILYHSHDAPHVAGRVVSRATGKPIADASVSISSDASRDGKGHTVRTSTDAHGYFSLPELDHWFIGPLSEGIVDGEGTLSVEAPGYRPHREKRRMSEDALTILLA